MAVGEFFLAHDWQESFDVSFFHFFPAMESPFRDALIPPSGIIQRRVSRRSPTSFRSCTSAGR